MVSIREYDESDAPKLSRLFYETVHAVNQADYSPEQVRAWAPEAPDPGVWHARLSSQYTLVAEEGGEVVGFAALEDSGYLDTLYSRKDYVGRGIGSRLYQAVEQKARERGIKRIRTEASITARPFFERHGFRVIREQTVIRQDVELTNFAMEKLLTVNDGARR